MRSKTKADVTTAPARVGALRVANEIARAIERGDYEPGERLKEQELADKFGLSRAPIREALRLLESQGLAVIEQMRGARVVRPDEAQFRELWLIRAALAGVVAELVAASPDLEAKERLHEQTKLLAQKARGGAEARVIYEGLRNQTRMVSEMTSASRARTMLQSLSSGREAFQMRAIKTPERRIEATEIWVRLSQAILAGDGPGAANFMQELYRKSMQFVSSEEAQSGKLQKS